MRAGMPNLVNGWSAEKLHQASTFRKLELEIKDNKGSGNLTPKFAFSLNPLISEIALWNDSEILDARPEFAVLDRATRVAEICKKLLLNDVAWVDFLSPPIWIPADLIERDCGGSKNRSLLAL